MSQFSNQFTQWVTPNTVSSGTIFTTNTTINMPTTYTANVSFYYQTLLDGLGMENIYKYKHLWSYWLTHGFINLSGAITARGVNEFYNCSNYIAGQPISQQELHDLTLAYNTYKWFMKSGVDWLYNNI